MTFTLLSAEIPETKKSSLPPTSKKADNSQKDNTPESIPDLSREEGINKNLSGERGCNIEQGKNIELLNAEYKKHIKNLIFDIIKNNTVQEIQGNLNAGMSILFTGEITTIDEYECYIISLGTHHEDHFVKEIIYAVNVNTKQIYRFDVINDTWVSVAFG